VKRALFVVRLLIVYPLAWAVVIYGLTAFGNAYLGIRLLPIGVVCAFLIMWYLAIVWYSKQFIARIRDL
jgi:hypothetical protein